MRPRDSIWPKEQDSPAFHSRAQGSNGSARVPLQLASWSWLREVGHGGAVRTQSPVESDCSVSFPLEVIPGYPSTKVQRSQARLPRDYGLWLTILPAPCAMKA